MLRSPSLFEFLLASFPEQLLKFSAPHLVEPRDPVFGHVDVQLVYQREILLRGTERKSIKAHALTELGDDLHALLLATVTVTDGVQLVVGQGQGLVALFAQQLLLIE